MPLSNPSHVIPFLIFAAEASTTGYYHEAVLLRDVPPGLYTLRADQTDAGGKVSARFETPFLRETREATAAWLKEQTYKDQPLEVAESGSNFLLFGGHFDKREAIFDELLKRGVLIRVVGPDGWLRVCMGTDEEMETFRNALVEVLRIVEAA